MTPVAILIPAARPRKPSRSSTLASFWLSELLLHWCPAPMRLFLTSLQNSSLCLSAGVAHLARNGLLHPLRSCPALVAGGLIHLCAIAPVQAMSPSPHIQIHDTFLEQPSRWAHNLNQTSGEESVRHFIVSMDDRGAAFDSQHGFGWNPHQTWL